MLENQDLNFQAAIYLHVYGNCNDWKQLYIIAVGFERFNKLSDNSKIQYVSKWKNSELVLFCIDELKKRKYLDEQNQIKKAIQDSETETTKSKDITNFLSLDEFLQYANEQANSITDEKERRAWVEMIGKYMNFKGSDEGETEQIKAYLPVQCYNCAIYNRCKSCEFEACPVETL